MKQIEQFKWYLPARNPRGKPYISGWHMTAEEAAKRGALRPEPGTRMVIDVGETPDEIELVRLRTDTSPSAAARAAALKKKMGLE
jgi:hypothetical protein